MSADHDAGDNNHFDEFPNAGLSHHHASGVDTARLLQDVEAQLKQLVQPGAYSTRYERAVWTNRFFEFRSKVLSVADKNTVPTGKDITRFILYHFQATVPQAADMTAVDTEPDSLDLSPPTQCIWSYTTARGVVTILYDAFKFRYADFQPSPNAKDTSLAAIEQLCSNGFVTKEAKIDREQPLGVYHIYQMVQALFNRAMSNSNASWDATIQFSLVIVLQAAFSCRIGDILDTGYPEAPPRPALYYSDVVLTLRPGCHTVADICGQWTIRNAKNSDGDSANSYTLVRNALPNGASNVICPVRLLLINAMRRGNLSGSLDNIISDAVENDGRIRWIEPNLPVLCSTIPTGIVDQSVPMKVHAARMILDTVAGLVKPSVFMRSHDIRYGAAHDMIHLPASDRMSDEEIGLELNHSVISNRTTRKYRGPRQRDIWSERVQHLANQRPTHSVVLFGCHDPVLRRNIVGKDEVLAEMRKRHPELMDLPRTDVRYSKEFAVTYRYLQARRADARSRKVQAADMHLGAALQTANVPSDDNFIDVFATRQRSSLRQKPSRKRTRDEAIIAHNSSLPDKHQSINRMLTCEICSVRMTGFAALRQHLVRKHDAGFPAACPIRSCTSTEVFKTFANLHDHVTYTHVTALLQRDAQNRPEYPCRVPGCPKRFTRSETFDSYKSHLLSTHRVTFSEALPSEQLEDVHHCLYPGCASDELFEPNNRQVYMGHLTEVHGASEGTEQFEYSLAFIRQDWLKYYWKCIFPEDELTAESDLLSWVPNANAVAGKSRVHKLPRKDTVDSQGKYPCQIPGCRTTYPFKEEKTLHEHQLKAHDHFLPTKCPTYGCQHSGIFRTFNELQSHMNDNHLDAIGHKYQEFKASARFSCLYPGCDHLELFYKADPSKDTYSSPYQKHLGFDHDLWAREERLLYTTKMYAHANAWVGLYTPTIVRASLSQLESSKTISDAAPIKLGAQQRVCPLPTDQCIDSGKVFPNLAKYKKHVVLRHDECYPTPCPFDDCNEKGFQNYDALNFHVKEIHMSKIKDAATKSKRDDQRCLYPGCDDTNYHMSTQMYKVHLTTHHGISGLQQRPYLLTTYLSWVELYYNMIYGNRTA